LLYAIALNSFLLLTYARTDLCKKVRCSFEKLIISEIDSQPFTFAKKTRTSILPGDVFTCSMQAWKKIAQDMFEPGRVGINE
jgi:hypothetical protein